MGDCIVESVVKFSLHNLLRLLSDEVKLGSDVKDKIRSLTEELEYMDAFLKTAEGKHTDDLVKVLVNQIRDVAYEAEDVVDTYVANVTLQKRRKIFTKLSHCLCQAVMLRDVGAKVDRTKKRIEGINKNKEKYNIGEGESESERGVKEEAAKSCKERRRHVEEQEVEGLEHDSNVVIGKLKEENSCLTVNFILGMGGLGKTTLARKIYNTDKVKVMFSYHAWGYASNDYKVSALLLSLLQCLNSSTLEYKDLSVEQLRDK